MEGSTGGEGGGVEVELWIRLSRVGVRRMDERGDAEEDEIREKVLRDGSEDRRIEAGRERTG